MAVKVSHVIDRLVGVLMAITWRAGWRVGYLWGRLARRRPMQRRIRGSSAVYAMGHESRARVVAGTEDAEGAEVMHLRRYKIAQLDARR